MNSKLKILLPVLALIAYVALVWPWGNPEVQPFEISQRKNNSKISAKNKSSEIPKPQKDPNFKPEVVEKPKSTVEEKKFYRTTSPEGLAHAENERIAMEEGPGETPALTKEQIKESKQLQSVIEAIKEPGKLASRLTPLAKASPFDKQRFNSDANYKEEYLNTAEPARVYQSDPTSKYKIKRKSPYYQEVVQGESVLINVEAEPNMPVSITSFDLGKFANHLTYQTVLADASGSATFEFFGMPGTFNNTNILVSSPTSKGQLKFVVYTKIKTENSN